MSNKMALDALTEPKAVSLTDVLQAAAPAEIADALAPVVQAVQAGEYPPLPEGVKARFKCEDCDGTGYTGEMIRGSEFQPPEPVGCTSCRFTGWWAECEAYSADQMHAYLDADRASSGAAQAVRPDPKNCTASVGCTNGRITTKSCVTGKPLIDKGGSSDGERDYYECPDCGKDITIDYREN